MEPSDRCAGCAFAGRGQRAARERERDLVRRVALGQTIKEIALEWGRSAKTVEYHWALAKAKYNITCPQDAVWCALRLGWLKWKGGK